jgi:hypothetical protein
VADEFCSQRNNMHGVIRKYSGKGANDFFNLLEKRKSEVENAFRPVKGFVSYTLVHCGDGGFSVTICEDKAGADESVRVAKDWIVNNAENTGVGAPQVSEGSVIIHMDSH